MMNNVISNYFNLAHIRDLVTGALKITPLCIAVLPWGLLAGSMAIQAGLSPAQAIGMSAFVFAGAAQLVSLGMIMAGAPLISIVLSVFLITSQHYLYALKLRSSLKNESFGKRVLLGFVLTDELFAISSTQPHYNYRVLLGAGIWFYLCWLVFSFFGVLLTSSFSQLEHMHLDFSIVATFIAIIVPLIQNRHALIGVITTLVLTALSLYLNILMGGLIAALIGMCVAAWSESKEKKE